MFEDNPEFKLATELLNSTNLNFFVSGKAGTGKSSWIRNVVATSSKNIIVVAPTGVAALNVGGSTIHSFFNLPTIPIVENDSSIKAIPQTREKYHILNESDTIIIDEISMVRADLLDGIDQAIRLTMAEPNLPFGGKQIVLVGDIFQLPPVVTDSHYNVLKEIYRTDDESFNFFTARVYKDLNPVKIELSKNYRQLDKQFDGLIEKMRINSGEQSLSYQDLDYINSKVNIGQPINDEFTISLTSSNYYSNLANKEKLAALNTPLFTFEASITGEYDSRKYPTDYILELKKGSQIILLKNDNQHRWVNGTIAKIDEVTSESIQIALTTGEIYPLEKAEWENVELTYDKKKKKVIPKQVGTFTQYPIKLAWSITIHKSQGLTFDKCIINLNEQGYFATGQCYTAFSRTRTLEGVYINRQLRASDFSTSESLYSYYTKFDADGVFDSRMNNIQWALQLYDSKKPLDFWLEYNSYTDWLNEFKESLAAQNYSKVKTTLLFYHAHWNEEVFLFDIKCFFEDGRFSSLFTSEGHDLLKGLVFYYVSLSCDNQIKKTQYINSARLHVKNVLLKTPNMNAYLLFCRILSFEGSNNLARLIFKHKLVNTPSSFILWIGAKEIFENELIQKQLYLGAWILNPTCIKSFKISFNYISKKIKVFYHAPQNKVIKFYNLGLLEEMYSTFESTLVELKTKKRNYKYALLDLFIFDIRSDLLSNVISQHEKL